MRILITIIALLFAPLAWCQLNLELLAHVPNDSGITLAGCWYHVDSFENEYALLGTKAGLDIYDITEPSMPVRKFQVPGVPSNWREVKTWGGFAYIGSEGAGSGITIVDMRHLPDSIRWKVWYGNDSLDNKIQKSHTVGAHQGYLYIYGSTAPNNGAIICDLSDPWNPNFEGQYQLNYLHDGYIRGDTLWGSEIYEGQFSVIDISDKTNPVLLATQKTPAAFNHNTELSKNGHFLFATDEKQNAPLSAFDVSQLDNIIETDRYYPSQKPSAEVHNVRVYGDDFLVCPSYGGQLTIVDASDPYNLIETAWAVMGTSLVWDAVPYLPSGVIFAGAKNEGLFIYKPTYTRAARLEGVAKDAISGNLLQKVKVFLLDTPNADTTGFDGHYATGAALGGAYNLMAVKNGYDTLWVNNINLVNGETQLLNLSLVPIPTPIFEAADTKIKVAVFPMPAVSHCNIFFEEFQTNTPLEVLDLNGKIVVQTIVNGLQKSISTAHLKSGVYFIKVENQITSRIQVVKTTE